MLSHQATINQLIFLLLFQQSSSLCNHCFFVTAGKQKKIYRAQRCSLFFLRTDQLNPIVIQAGKQKGREREHCWALGKTEFLISISLYYFRPFVSTHIWNDWIQCMVFFSVKSNQYTMLRSHMIFFLQFDIPSHLNEIHTACTHLPKRNVEFRAYGSRYAQSKTTTTTPYCDVKLYNRFD